MKRRGGGEKKRRGEERKRRRRGVTHLHTSQLIVTRALRLSFFLLPSLLAHYASPSSFFLLPSSISGNAGFDVPRTFAFCEDNSVIGTPFYLMDFVKGGEERGGKGKRGKGKRGKDTRKRGKGKDISHTKGYACASLVCPCVSLCFFAFMYVRTRS